eukprot:6202262-Ditylum_brightwellii.AAC.1
MQNIDSEVNDLDQQVEEAKRRQASLILHHADLQERPLTWLDSAETSVEVTHNDEQYWDVHDKLRESLSTTWISKI